jgi:polysaccharide export outer membrane protein
MINRRRLESAILAIWIGLGWGAIARAQGLSVAQDPGANSEAMTLTQEGASNPQALAQRLGLTPEQLSSYQSAIASGGLSSDQLEALSARAQAKGLSAQETAAIARSMGLSAAQIEQLRGRAQVHSQLPARAASPVASGVSALEQKFALLDQPDALPPPPDTRHLRQFGYSLFSAPVSTFAPVAEVPVSGDYVLGPGDQLNINTWGRFSRSQEITVDRNGAIFLAEVGPLQVAGLTFGQAQKLIEGHLDQITGIDSQVTMGRLRTIGIFVLGEVAQPGAYTVSALARISNGLRAAGGINPTGSLRQVQLRRQGRVVATLDLYDLLLRGDNRADLRLQARDVIFVPVIGSVAAVAGEIKRPAIYELRGSSASLQEVLRMAGGATPFSYAQRLQVIRTANHSHMLALDIDLEHVAEQRFQVQDGDLIKIYSVLPGPENEVVLSGNVRRPGSYQLYDGMKVTDLIRRGEGVLPHTFFAYALLKRLQGADRTTLYQPLHLGDLLADPGDQGNVLLRAGDELVIYGENQMQSQPTVRVEGEVRAPGLYPLSHGMRVSDLVYAAGGAADQAYLARAELARTQVLQGARTVHTFYNIDLQAALRGDQNQNPILRDNDELSIWAAPGWHLPWLVTVQGEVPRPGPYTIRKGERLGSLLKRCGGLLPDAYLPGLILIRESIRKREQEQINIARSRLAAGLAQLQLTQAQSSNSGNPPAATNFDTLERLLSQAQGLQAPGRLIVQLGPLDGSRPSDQDVMLEDQDRIMVPKVPSAVSVMGQVYAPTAIVYDPAMRVEDYLQRAGGPTELADPENIFVIKANGLILTRRGYDLSRRSQIFPFLPVISGGLMASRLQPGDTVYVPDKIVRSNKLEVARDVATIIGQSATALGMIGVLAVGI